MATQTTTLRPGYALPQLVKHQAIKCNFVVEIKPANRLIGESHVEPTTAINSIDISPCGQYVAAANGDNTISIIDIHDSKNKWTNPVQKYGASNIRFLPNNKTAVCSSTKTNNDLRLLSFERPGKACYLRYFHGHTSLVGALDITSDGRNVISAAAIEKKVFLWDVNTPTPVARMHVSKDVMNMRKWSSAIFPKDKPRTTLAPQPVVAFDPGNMVFAVAYRDNPDFIKLYDLRNYSNGPFMSSKLEVFDDLIAKHNPEIMSEEEIINSVTAIGADLTQMKFSPDGKTILLNTNGPFFYLFNSVTLNLKKPIFRSHRKYNNKFDSRAPEVSFTPDSQQVIGGTGSNTDPRIYVWDVKTGGELGIINSESAATKPNFNLCVNFVKHSKDHLVVIAAGGHRVSSFRPSSLAPKILSQNQPTRSK